MIRRAPTTVLQAGRRQAARSVNTIMCAVYGDIGRQIVGFEQKGPAKAEYSEQLTESDLDARAHWTERKLAGEIARTRDYLEHRYRSVHA